MKRKRSAQSLGGLARAAKLSPEERSSIAQKAAAARWGSSSIAQAIDALLDGVTCISFGEVMARKDLVDPKDPHWIVIDARPEMKGLVVVDCLPRDQAIEFARAVSKTSRQR